MNEIFHVKDHMTHSPDTVSESDSVREALDRMRNERVRHLPVLRDKLVVGILSDRDIKWGMSFGMPETLLVGEVMTPDPFIISPECSLEEVVFNMVDRRIGAAVVCETSGELRGIFTTIDALRAFLGVLERGGSYRQARVEPPAHRDLPTENSF